MDERLDATLGILERLVNFDTESSKSNLALVSFVEDYFKALGVSYVKIPNAGGDKAHAWKAFVPDDANGPLTFQALTRISKLAEDPKSSMSALRGPWFETRGVAVRLDE